MPETWQRATHSQILFPKSSKFHRRVAPSTWLGGLLHTHTATPASFKTFRESLHASTYLAPFFPTSQKGSGKSHCYISLSSRGTSPLHSGDHRYINFCAGDTYLTTYLPVTSSSQETTPAPASSNHQPKLYTHHLFNTPTVKPTLHTRISTHFPTIFFMVWRL